jgi:hypothetical protein
VANTFLPSFCRLALTRSVKKYNNYDQSLRQDETRQLPDWDKKREMFVEHIQMIGNSLQLAVTGFFADGAQMITFYKQHLVDKLPAII